MRASTWQMSAAIGQRLREPSTSDARQAPRGHVRSLYLRQYLHRRLFSIGCFIQRRPGSVLFVGLLVLGTLSLHLTLARLEYDLETLWSADGDQVREELARLRVPIDALAASSDQLVIQTTRKGGNILRNEALRTHAELLGTALQVRVELHDHLWSLRDVCVRPRMPTFHPEFMNDLLENFAPCLIVTPLQCFWEGSKLLNPGYSFSSETLGVYNLTWTNLFPRKLFNDLKTGPRAASIPFDVVEQFIAQAGITTGYQTKPCLDPFDSQCPSTAPNRNSYLRLTLGAILTNGCYGFASKYMHWPGDLTTGGIIRDHSGSVMRAEALRSIIRIMDDNDIYELHDGMDYAQDIGWSVGKARQVALAWQKAFAREVDRLSRLRLAQQFRFALFTAKSLKSVLLEFTWPDINWLLFGATAIWLCQCVVQILLSKPSLSDIFIDLVGALLHGFSILGGLGACVALGLRFNAMTTRVLPLLCFGIGRSGAFYLGNTLKCIRSTELVPNNVQIGECLRRTGLTIALTNLSLVLAFAAASLIPVPALSCFALQGAVVQSCSAFVGLLLFPAVLSLELHWPMEADAPTTAELEDFDKTSTVSSRSLSQQRQPSVDGTVGEECGKEEPTRQNHSTQSDYYQRPPFLLRKSFYTAFIHRLPIQTSALMAFMIFLSVSSWRAISLEDGLRLTDVIPATSNEHEFLYHQERHFGMYRIFAATGPDFDYAANQTLLHDYYSALGKLDNILTDDNGVLPGFWLSHFRDWLTNLQNTFDSEWQRGYIYADGWNKMASNDAILAYKLLVQTGRTDRPVHKAMITWNRLVDANGIINPKAFYNYLTAWYNYDPLAYAHSGASLRPRPKLLDAPLNGHVDVRDDKDLIIRKSQSIQLAQIPLYLRGVHTFHDVAAAISRVRSLNEQYQAQGLPNVLLGLEALNWLQCLTLRPRLALAMGLVLAVICAAIAVTFNIWTSLVLVFILGASSIQAVGVLPTFDSSLNAVSAALLVVGVGVGMDVVLHPSVVFVTAAGSRAQRVDMALAHVTTPGVNSTVGKLLVMVILAFSEFNFVVTYFSRWMLVVVAIYAFNAFVVLPVLLSLVGPSEILAEERLAEPSRSRVDNSPKPPPSSRLPDTQKPSHVDSHHQEQNHRRRHSSVGSRVSARPSVSSIPEERLSYRSLSADSLMAPLQIFVTPEITVKTITVTSKSSRPVNANSSASDAGTSQDPEGHAPNPSRHAREGKNDTTHDAEPPPCKENVAPPEDAITTTVKATAKFQFDLSPLVHG
ncbi:protein patched-like [Tropilaelaps mercedesae]|uniref:Protein patched-like n=1 Tax=Tropilaelaps mercedesae TaxID=418985 RepID=A0A1V9X0N8_9ACAR|nr:protein patched-like [Tropilaelaps mercedesae]